MFYKYSIKRDTHTVNTSIQKKKVRLRLRRVCLRFFLLKRVERVQTSNFFLGGEERENFQTKSFRTFDFTNLIDWKIIKNLRIYEYFFYQNIISFYKVKN